MDNREDFIDPNKCPKCGGTLFDIVDRVDGSHYIGCHTPGCKWIEYEDPEDESDDTYDEYDAACDKADAEFHDLRDSGLI
jgi:ssDNA-binding Zn-finger/Zn-ribbon topoisomerase 1